VARDSQTRLDLDELRARRLRAQCLEPRLPRAGLPRAVKALIGVQAQLPSAAALALRARVRGLTAADLHSALGKAKLIRTWCMRGTLHLMAAADVEWALAAVPASTIRAAWQWLERRAGLKPDRAAQLLDEAHDLLRERGPLTRRELMAALAQAHGAGIAKAAHGLGWLGGLQGRFAYPMPSLDGPTPDRDAQPTYAALDSLLGRPVRVATWPDLRLLALRYLQGYGPAGPRDLAAWWGLPQADAAAAFEANSTRLERLDAPGGPMWAPRSAKWAAPPGPAPSPLVRLLPAFDNYLLGYRSREAAVAPEHQGRVFHGGMLVPVVVVDGQAAGVWRYEKRGNQIRIRAAPFASFSARAREAIAEEADDIGRFYGLAAALTFVREV
jgi:hypothetical protein